MVHRITTPYSYSSAVVAGDYVFIGLHRGHGESFTQQIHDTFAHLKETLQQCNISLDLKWKRCSWIILNPINFLQG